MSDIAPQLAAVLEDDAGILETFGMTVVRARDGACLIESTVPDQLVNAGGFAHGAIAFSLLDTASAYCVRSLGTRGVTTSANLHYVRGAVGGDRLRAEVQVMHRTRRTASLRGEVLLEDAGEWVLAAHGTFGFQLLIDR